MHPKPSYKHFYVIKLSFVFCSPLMHKSIIKCTWAYAIKLKSLPGLWMSCLRMKMNPLSCSWRIMCFWFLLTSRSRGVHMFKSNGFWLNQSNPIIHWMLDFVNQINLIGCCIRLVLSIGYFDRFNLSSNQL